MDCRVDLLTKREVELLHHVFLGRKTWEIARIEGIAQQTVANRIQDAKTKLGGVDRRRAALMVAEAKGWTPGIKATPDEITLFDAVVPPPSAPVSHGGSQSDRQGEGFGQEGGVFVQTRAPERPMPLPPRRNTHDLPTRISMLLVRIAILLAATVALLWVYGRG